MGGVFGGGGEPPRRASVGEWLVAKGAQRRAQQLCKNHNEASCKGAQIVSPYPQLEGPRQRVGKRERKTKERTHYVTTGVCP